MEGWFKSPHRNTSDEGLIPQNVSVEKNSNYVIHQPTVRLVRSMRRHVPRGGGGCWVNVTADTDITAQTIPFTNALS